VDETAEPVASSDAGVVVGGRGIGRAVGWFLAERPVRPVGVAVIDVFAESDVAGR
jgi:glycine/D-amino acid oxidase-like deaminating enzyme